jgi:hypothetical protein
MPARTRPASEPLIDLINYLSDEQHHVNYPVAIILSFDYTSALLMARDELGIANFQLRNC